MLFLNCVQVSAQEKASGKSQNITITSDKGRLSAEEIDRMLNEAEKNAEADKQLKEAVDAKNVLEMYLYQMKSAVTSTLKGKISKDSEERVMTTLREAESWLESNGATATDKNVFEDKKSEVEAVVGPLIAEAYKSAAASAGSNKNAKNSGPTVEEVDPSSEDQPEKE